MAVLYRFLVVVATMVPLIQGHFTFMRVKHNNNWLEPTRFVRNKTEPFEEQSTPNANYNTRMVIDPTYATDIPNSVRCGRDNMNHSAATEVLIVQSGDTVEMAHQRWDPAHWTDDMWVDCPDDRGSCEGNPKRYMDFNHPGPFLAHLSKVPEGQDIHTYDGSGEWVKIYRLGVERRNATSKEIKWLPWNDQGIPAKFVVKIPAETPAGQYLLRVDLIFLGLDYLGAVTGGQLYPSCVQLLVQSPIKGNLPKGIKIPEDFSNSSPGMVTSIDMSRGQTLDEGYVYPGGPLWDGTSLIEDRATY